MYTLFLQALLAIATGQGIIGDLESGITIDGNIDKGDRDGEIDDSGETNSLTNRLHKDLVQPGDTSWLKNNTCVTETGETGECVPYFLCNGNNTVINDGIGTINISARGGPCFSYLDTCCLLPDKRPTDNPIRPKAFSGPNNSHSNGSDDQVPNPQTQRIGCGWRNPEGVGMKTIGDDNGEVKFGEFPWTVIVAEPIEVHPIEFRIFVGGGSLIHPSVVLTAAHLTTRPRLRAYAGAWDLRAKKEIYPYQERDVESKVIHKDFNNGTLFYDIALLFLSQPMELTPNVGIACLPPPRERVPGGTLCFASGWKNDFKKRNSFLGNKYPIIQKKVEVPVVDRNTCQKTLRETRLGPLFELHSSFMCAAADVKDTCRGDGGSALVCPIEFENGRYMQSGIVAWTVRCGQNGSPDVYVDVSNLRDWIDDKVKGKGYDTRGYSFNI